MRILDLTKRFSANRRISAPHGSLEDTAMRRELARLASERSELSLPGDEDALWTPFVVIWAHPIPVPTSCSPTTSPCRASLCMMRGPPGAWSDSGALGSVSRKGLPKTIRTRSSPYQGPPILLLFRGRNGRTWAPIVGCPPALDRSLGCKSITSAGSSLK